MEYSDGCSIAIRYVVRKMAAMEGRFVWFGGGFHRGDVISGPMDLYMTPLITKTNDHTNGKSLK